MARSTRRRLKPDHPLDSAMETTGEYRQIRSGVKPDTAPEAVRRCVTVWVRLWRIRPKGAPGCCYGWSPPEAHGTRGAGMLSSSSPRMGRRVCANGYGSAYLRPCRGGDRGWIFQSTGSASPGLRLVALHPWQQPSVPPGPLQGRLNCRAPGGHCPPFQSRSPMAYKGADKTRH